MNKTKIWIEAVRLHIDTVNELVHAAHGSQHTVELPAGHSEPGQIDGLEGNPAFLEIALRFFGVEAFAFAEDLNVQ